MANLPAAGVLTDNARTEGQMKQALEDQRTFIAQFPGGDPEEALIIAAGVITPTRGVFSVDTEAASASDDLDRIATTNLPDGSIVRIHALSASHAVVVRNAQGGTGQISLSDGLNFTLSDPTMWLTLRLKSSVWEEVDRHFGNQVAALAVYAGVVKKSGDTMTGALALPAVDPASANIAARKQYVDDRVATTVPLDGTRDITGDLKQKKASPTIRIVGTDGGAVEYRLRSSGGVLTVDKNTGSEVSPVWATVVSINLSTNTIKPAGKFHLDASAFPNARFILPVGTDLHS